ncbi:ANR family transcriptional regulator [Vibrio harveyi]
MENQYLEFAQQACEAERCNDWEKACHCWLKAIQYAYGVNSHWATNHFEFCCSLQGIRPSTFISAVL